MKNIVALFVILFVVSAFEQPQQLRGKVIFLDSFDDNKYGWVNETTDDLTKLRDGFLFYANPFAFEYYDAKPLAFDMSKDYYAEIKLRYVSGDVDGYNGLFMGDIVAGTKNIFEVSALGKVRIRQVVDNSINVLYEGKIPAVKPTGFNILGIEKKGGQFIYFLNGKEVYRCNAFDLTGQYLGFTISGGAYVQFANLGLWYVNN